jgi:hypothetical protein
VLEGSVQKSGDRVRITAQLNDALNGHHLWAERYDRNLKDVFTIQDEITLKILTAMRVKLVHGEEASTYEKYFKGEKGLSCYLEFLEGVKNFQILSIDGNNTARRITEEAIKICPDNSMVHLLLGWICWGDLILGSSTSPRETFVKGFLRSADYLKYDQAREWVGRSEADLRPWLHLPAYPSPRKILSKIPRKGALTLPDRPPSPVPRW